MHYAVLTPAEQKELLERIELRFLPQAVQRYRPTDRRSIADRSQKHSAFDNQDLPAESAEYP